MSILKRLLGKQTQEPVIVVSGLPRSGTSMMMKMLSAGGLEVVTDNLRTPDASNPKGYFEFEPVKKLKEGQTEWVAAAGGKPVKVISALLAGLPREYHYKVIFMHREMDEILASQRRMLERNGKPAGDVPDEQMAGLYKKHLQQVEEWLTAQPHMEVLYISYNEILQNPRLFVEQICTFLGGKLNRDAMLAAVDPRLYRERAG